MIAFARILALATSVAMAAFSASALLDGDILWAIFFAVLGVLNTSNYLALSRM